MKWLLYKHREKSFSSDAVWLMIGALGRCLQLFYVSASSARWGCHLTVTVTAALPTPSRTHSIHSMNATTLVQQIALQMCDQILLLHLGPSCKDFSGTIFWTQWNLSLILGFSFHFPAPYNRTNCFESDLLARLFFVIWVQSDYRIMAELSFKWWQSTWILLVMCSPMASTAILLACCRMKRPAN